MTVPYGPIESDLMPPQLGPYSHAVRSGQPDIHGRTSGLSTRRPMRPKGRLLTIRRGKLLENLSTVLQAAGSGLQYVVKTTIFMADGANFATLNQLFKEYFPTKPPARSVPIVQLPRGLLISIEAVAVLPDDRGGAGTSVPSGG